METKVLSLFDDEYLNQPLPKQVKGTIDKIEEKKEDPTTSPIEDTKDESPVSDSIVNEKPNEISENIEDNIDNQLSELDKQIAIETSIHQDYFQSISIELPTQPLKRENKSSIVFEGFVEEKKTIQPNIEIETKPLEPESLIAEKEESIQDTDTENEIHQENETISTLPDFDLEDKYYGIGEVAKLFGVNNSHIRFWTNEFKLKPRTTRKGDRLYSKEDIAQLKIIYHLVKERKHTIKGAQEKLKQQKQNVVNELTLKDSLISLRNMMVTLRNQL